MAIRQRLRRGWIVLLAVSAATLLAPSASWAGRLNNQTCPLYGVPDRGSTPATHDDLVTQFMALPVLDETTRLLGRFDLDRNVWWALRSQRNLEIDRPVSAVTHLASHNAFNDCADGFSISNIPGIAAWQPNQGFSMIDQLRIGSRMLELDVHEVSGELWLRHADGEDVAPYLDKVEELADWLAEPENVNEILFIDIEDHGGGDAHILIPLAYFGPAKAPGSWIFTPEDRIAYGGWPSRRELLEMNKRVIVFDHGDRSFGELQISHSPLEDADVPPGQTFFLNSQFTFRTDEVSDPSPYAITNNFNDREINDARGDISGYNALPESRKSFFAVRGDGQSGGADRMEALDIINFVRLPNINFLKFDFLLTVEADLEGESDPSFQMSDDARNFRLAAAVWSWNFHDPASLRQIFQDLFPGDGTGDALRAHFDTYATDFWTADDAPVSDALAALGAEARANGRDYAVQGWDDRCALGALVFCGRWNSRADADHRFACASAPVPALDRLWAVTTASGKWHEGPQACAEEFPGSVFGGPVTAMENHDLLLSRFSIHEEVWIHVDDADRDGNWVAEQVPEPGAVACLTTALATLGGMARRRRGRSR